MSIFQRNKKMRKSSVLTYNFSLPAVSTCPGAGACAKAGYCFALLEQMRYPSARKYREHMLELSRSDWFEIVVNDELAYLKASAKRKGKQLAIRIHASGDFYNIDYLNKWTAIAQANPDVVFYAYTKSVWLFKRVQLPTNLTVIFSLGGIADRLVDVETDRHSRIFASVEAAIAAGYNAAASEDDSAAWLGVNHKVGLVMFGARKNKGNQALGNT